MKKEITTQERIQLLGAGLAPKHIKPDWKTADDLKALWVWALLHNGCEWEPKEFEWETPAFEASTGTFIGYDKHRSSLRANIAMAVADYIYADMSDDEALSLEVAAFNGGLLGLIERYFAGESVEDITGKISWELNSSF